MAFNVNRSFDGMRYNTADVYWSVDNTPLNYFLIYFLFNLTQFFILFFVSISR